MMSVMRVQRALACLAIAVYAMGQLASFAHHAQVRHIRCAQHGELVDVRAVVLETTSVSGHLTLVGRTDSEVVGDGDEHCAFTAASRPALYARVAHTLATTAPVIHTDGPRDHVVHASQLEPLSVAPKTSPPGTASV